MVTGRGVRRHEGLVSGQAKMYADIWGTVPYSLGAYETLADELLEREK